MENSKKTIDELIEAVVGTIGALAPHGSLVEKIGEERYSAILRKTVYSLPDRPSDVGMTAAQIKEAFYKPITDKEGSIYAEINRIAEELNLGGAQIEEVLTLMSELVAAIYNNSVDKTSFDDKMKEVAESLGKCVKRADGEGENIYASAGGKDQLVPISSEALPNTAVKRDNAGHVKVTAPAAEDDAVSLGYARRTFAQRGDVPTSGSNALIGSEMGEVVALKDVSPIEHRLGVKVESKNLLPYPFFETTKTANGIKFTDNRDGSITMNGVCSGDRAIFYLYCKNDKDSIFNLNQNLTLSGAPKNASDMGFFVEIACSNVNDGSTTWVGDNGSGWILTPEWVLNDLYIVVKEGTVLDNVTFYPMLEKGITKTGHAPYLANPEAVKIMAQDGSGNLFDVYSITETEGIEIAGETVKGNRVDDVLYNPLGSTWNPNRYEGFALRLPKGKYAVSCDAYTNLSNTGWVSCYLYPTNGSYDDRIKPEGTIHHSCPVGTLTHFKWVFDLANYGEFYLGLQGGGNDANYSFLDLSFRNIQVKLGEESKYAPYVEPIEYSQGEDIKSIYPSTILMTDTKGAVVEVEYNKDINKAFAELYQAIISLGGNV